MAKIKQGKEYVAIHAAQTFGPWFGANDILIQSNSNGNKGSYCDFGQAYQLPAGYFAKSKEARALLAGEYNFSTSEIEVFY